MKTHATPSRRKLLQLAAAALSVGIIPMMGRASDDSDNDYETGDDDLSSNNTTLALANTGLKANIVVIGGGMAGVTAAKYLRLWGAWTST